MSTTERATISVNEQRVTITNESQVVTILDNQHEDIVVNADRVAVLASFRAKDKDDVLGDVVEGVLKITGTDTIDTEVSGTTVTVDVIDSALAISASQLTSGSLSIDLIPDTDQAYDLGSSDYRWGDIHGSLDGPITFRAKVSGGGTLSIGDVVYISGSTGAETPDVALADADDSAKMPAFGLISAADGPDVHVTTFGAVTGIDLPSATYSVGDPVYVSTTAGDFTLTPPTGETGLIQKIGRVTRVNQGASANTGTLFVIGAGRTNAVPNLDDGNIFIGNASNQAITAPITDYAVSTVTGGTQIGVLTVGGTATVNHIGPGAIASTITEPSSVSIDSLGHVVNIGVSKISLEASQNLGDLPNIATARTNLGLGTAAEADISAFGETLIDDVDAAAARTTLGAAATNHNHSTGQITSGTFDDARIASSNVTQHAGDIDIQDLGNVVPGLLSNNMFLAYNSTSSNWTGRAPAAARTALGFSSFGSSLIDDADAAAARVTLDYAVNSPSMTGVSAGSITGIIKCSQAQYDAITPDAATLYVIV